MSKHQQIPRPDPEQKKLLETAFMKSFGKHYRTMRKEDMALMILTQSTNFQKINREAYEVVRIGLAMKRQRDYYHKLIRKYKKTLINTDGNPKMIKE